ncbi:MAG: cation:dicarboxylase symporter family transporter [Eubacterium sp.]|nr:cation:dicarboxylase symporter family transporter [Eubacterium sp.]
MKLKSTKQEYKLTPEAIDTVSEEIQEFLTGLKAQKKNIIETRLSSEEILLDLMDKYGSDTEFTFVKSSFFSRQFISFSVKGESFNPLEKAGDEDEFGDWSSALIQNADYTPTYSYDKGVNTVTIRFTKKQMNPVLKMFIAIIAAVLFSLLRFVIGEEAVTYIKESVLDPFYNTFLGLMKTVEVPLVFLSVACGIIGIGDSNVFGKIGRKMVLRFVGVILCFTSIAGVAFMAMFLNLKAHATAKISLKTGVEMLLDLIPDSLAEPISTGNTMQVVACAIFIAVAIVILGTKVKTIAKIINEGNSIIVYMTSLICRLLPVFIFIVLLDMIWSGNAKTFISMWRPIVAFIGVSAALFLGNLFYICFREKVKVNVLIKKMIPTFLIGFGTASSVAANGECAESLNRKMGLNKRFVEFGQPVGGVVFMPTTAINFMVCAIYMASYYKVNVSIMWFLLAIVICTFVAIATPPVPGGAIAAYTVIFAQLGIPGEALAIVIALDILFDFFATAFDGALMQLELIRQAEENNMLNYDVLRKPVK